MSEEERRRAFEHLKSFLNAAGYWPDETQGWNWDDEQMRDQIVANVEFQEGEALRAMFMVSNTLLLIQVKETA